MAESMAQPLSELMTADGLSPANRLVFDYWLALRGSKPLPDRTDFNPANVGPALARLCLFDVKAGEYLQCRVAGSAVVSILGQELSGLDYRAFTPPTIQASRMRTYDNILSGMVMRNARTAALTTGRQIAWQELVLPFGDVREDGARQVLIASDFGRFEYCEQVAARDEALGRSLTAEYFRA